MLRGAIEQHAAERCASRCSATGSFSLEIGGPKIDPGKRNSVPDIEWSKHIHRRIGERAVRRDRRGSDAGTHVAGRQYRRRAAELDCLLGTIGKDKPRYLAEHDDKDGHAYAAWRWN